MAVEGCNDINRARILRQSPHRHGEALVAVQKVRLGQTLRSAVSERLGRLEFIEPVVGPSVDDSVRTMPHPDSHSFWLALSQASPPPAFLTSDSPPGSSSSRLRLSFSRRRWAPGYRREVIAASESDVAQPVPNDRSYPNGSTSLREGEDRLGFDRWPKHADFDP